MRGIILLLLIIYIALIGFAFAQEPAQYNLGSAMGAKELTVSPGNGVEALIYFYNVYGNRITHISLSVAEAPENWEVEIEPELHTTTVDVSGVLTEVTENLYVEPDEIVDEIPSEPKEGFVYIPAPNVGGFIPAKEVKVKIKVPKDEKLGKTFLVKIEATGGWLGQTGSVDFKQNRSFEYTITTVAEEFYERIIEEPEAKEGEARIAGEEDEAEGEIAPTGLVGLVTGIAANPALVVLITTVVVVIVMLLIQFLIRKRK